MPTIINIINNVVPSALFITTLFNANRKVEPNLNDLNDSKTQTKLYYFLSIKTTKLK